MAGRLSLTSCQARVLSKRLKTWGFGGESGNEGWKEFEIAAFANLITVLTEDLMPGTIKGLKRHLRQRPAAAHTPLFVNRSGRRLTYDVLHTRWQALLVSSGLIEQDAEGKQRPRYTIHQLQHTAGTQFIAQFPEEVVSRMLGHSDPKSTRIYAYLNEDQVRAQLARRRK